MPGAGIDLNTVMLDQLVRVTLAELVRATVWVTVAVVAVKVVFRKALKRK